MSAGELARFIASIGALIGAMAWPVTVLVLLLKYGAPIGRALRPFVDEMAEKAKNGSLEASASFAGVSIGAKLIDSAAAPMAAAIEKDQEKGSSQGVSPDQARDVLARAIPDDRAAAQLDRSSLLWVDDHPENNTTVVKALNALGVSVTLARTTQEALSLLALNVYGVIISDMGRREGDRYVTQAGYQLLDTIRARGDNTPFIIYAGSRSPEHDALAREHGAEGSTNSATELIGLVTAALIRRVPSGAQLSR